MRNSIIRLLLCLGVIACCCGVATAQISVSATGKTIKDVILQIEKSSEYSFFYSDDFLDLGKKVSVNIKNETIESALAKLFKATNITYNIGKDKHIVLAVDTAKNGSEVPLRKYTGTVTDTGNGEPIAGASLSLKDNRHGTVTDPDGRFSIEAPAGSTLIISYIGYIAQEIKLGEDAYLRIIMQEDTKLLDEVVVIGYGTMAKKELTSAISHIPEKDFLGVGSISPVMMIQGKAPGVSITNTGTGDPNNQASIQIRGISSRSAGLNPLIVIDGIPGGNLTNLNPNDIASFDILKDGAASAIYGTRGSNGVVLVTTKKAQTDDVVHTSYNGMLACDVMKKELDMLNAQQYRDLRSTSSVGYDLGGNDNWLDAVSRIGSSMQHTLTVSRGNARSNYRASVDYRDAKGVDKRSGREEYGARASISHTTGSGLFTFSANIAPRIIYRDQASWGVFRNAIEANPTTPIMDPDNPGMYYSLNGQVAGSNPVETVDIEEDKGETKLLNWDAGAKLNLLPLLLNGGEHTQLLTTQLTFADNQGDNFNSWFRPSVSTVAISNGRTGEASRSYSKSRESILEWLTNYQANINGHNLKGMLGYSYQYNQSSGVSAENKDFPNDGLGANNLGAGEWARDEGQVAMGSYKNDSKLIAFFGRVSYDYLSKYLFTVSLRHEGSSKFGANNKWGNFPAVSAGWRISEEPFMKGIGWVDDLKIRGDFGVTGNQDFGSYLSLNTMGGFGWYFYNGTYFQVWGPAKNVNPDLKWEKGKNWNVGLDFSLFDSRVNGSLNYFNRHQQDLLGNYKVAVPPYLFDETFVNVGTMKNSGFEFDLNWNVLHNRHFGYTVNLVGSTMNNKFIDFSNYDFIGQDYYDVGSTEAPYPLHTLQRIEEGRRIGSFYMLQYAGIDTEGNWIVYDKDGDLIKADQATDDDRRFVGNGLPKFTGSMTHNFRYKNVDLSLFFRGAFGYDIFNVHDFYYGTKSFIGNVLQKAYGKNDKVTANPAVTDYFLERGDYVKLDMLMLGYTFDAKWKHLDKIRIYGTARNLLTFTKFSGVDPATYQVNGLTPGATGSRTYYPSSRQFIFGIQLDF
jgi:TonB-linked SusC/RagA family outer membrane protein